MSISIVEIIDPVGLDSKHWVHFQVGDNKEVIQITGVCSLYQMKDEEQPPDQWKQETVHMLIRMPVEPLYGSFFLVERAAPLVTISTISNDHKSNGTVGGVEQFECRIEDAALEVGEVFPITAKLVLRDRGAWSIRLGYSVTLLCSTLEDRPPIEFKY